MKISTLVIIILLSLMLIVGIILLPKNIRSKTLKVLILPIMWVISIITFPFWYIKSIFVNQKQNVVAIPVKVRDIGDGKVEIETPDGKKTIVDKPMEVNNGNGKQESK